jgi:Replication-relaxation
MSIAARTRLPRFTRADPSQRHNFQLTQRDIDIVRITADNRFVRSLHISQLLDASHEKISRRLASLYHHGYLDRPPAQLEYYRAGSDKMIYALANRGAQLLIHQHGLELADVDWSRKNFDAKRAFVLHQLAIVDLRVALILATRARGDLTLIEPRELIAAMPPATRTADKPLAWRVKVQHKGAPHEIGVNPDYAFALRYADASRRCYLVECDRGSMPVERAALRQTSIIKKLLTYQRGHKQKMHTRVFDWKAFRVLILTNTATRADNIRAAITRSPDLNGSELFYITDRHALAGNDILTHRWQHASGSTHTLL